MEKPWQTPWEPQLKSTALFALSVSVSAESRINFAFDRRLAQHSANQTGLGLRERGSHTSLDKLTRNIDQLSRSGFHAPTIARIPDIVPSPNIIPPGQNPPLKKM